MEVDWHPSANARIARASLLPKDVLYACCCTCGIKELTKLYTCSGVAKVKSKKQDQKQLGVPAGALLEYMQEQLVCAASC